MNLHVAFLLSLSVLGLDFVGVSALGHVDHTNIGRGIPICLRFWTPKVHFNKPNTKGYSVDMRLRAGLKAGSPSGWPCLSLQLEESCLEAPPPPNSLQPSEPGPVLTAGRTTASGERICACLSNPAVSLEAENIDKMILFFFTFAVKSQRCVSFSVLEVRHSKNSNLQVGPIDGIEFDLNSKVFRIYNKSPKF